MCQGKSRNKQGGRPYVSQFTCEDESDKEYIQQGELGKLDCVGSVRSQADEQCGREQDFYLH